MRRTVGALSVVVGLFAMLVVLGTASGAPGDLDPTFGSGGTVDTPIGASSRVSGLVIQPDGRIVAGGTSSVPVGQSWDNRFTVARYGTNGALDASFGSGGVTRGPEGGAHAIGLQPDGKIVLAGNRFILERGFRAYFTVSRFQPSGAVDTGFGSDGAAIGAEGSADSLAIQPDGKIVAAGTGGSTYPGYAFAVMRFNGDGTPDPSFGSEGSVQTLLGYGAAARDVVLQPDGKIIAAGSSVPGDPPPPPPPPPAPPPPPPPGPPPEPWRMTLVRYNADGSLDSSFGSGGVVRTAVGYSSQIYSLALRPDGKIVVAGWSDESIYGPGGLVLARYEPNGALDAAFGDQGLVTTTLDGLGSSMALQPDGMIVVAGQGVARFQPDGSADSTFGFHGVAGAGYPPLTGATVAIQPDGRIVTGGSRGSGFALNRYFATSPSTIVAGPLMVSYGRTSTIQGMVPGDRAGVQVQIVGRPCYGFGSFEPMATATTGPGGQWQARVRPGSRTTLQAKIAEETTAPLEVQVRPQVVLRRLSKGRFSTRVIAGHSLAGEIAVLQRRVGNRWVSSKRLVLRRVGKRGSAVVSGRTFGAAGTTERRLRILYTELGPDECYVAAASKPIRG
jgi:uncharacterized delta-60 repeat protein